MIAIIDYKAGNLTSVVKALTYLDAREITVTQDPAVVMKALKIVLPGVGHFQSTQLLTDLGLTEAIRESVARGTWFLGVCVGLQWLFAGSTESPLTPRPRPLPRPLRTLPCPVPQRRPQITPRRLELP